ncbi:flp pilus-assembly TadE/G-like family protein [Bifidobacterium callimiconis]|uniref:Rv3654c family TadE-like protein n=1 Tax=Bifidobacterium callimiconis TaxID=2306973 RepID=UPI001BDC8F32|nr:Rv3654c family TadE-like protein [Bifidobacterium callimiconis]MBT1177652.1 flp pilus-assembly TadE/G-like family protein [Bifidobacterium callimiconis]
MSERAGEKNTGNVTVVVAKVSHWSRVRVAASSQGEAGFLKCGRGGHCAADEGSGTVVGVGLVLMVGVLLTAILALGNVLHCKTVAGTAADSAALAGATALYDSAGDPCTVAKRLAKKNRATLETCRTLDEDVIVTVRVKTRVPLVGDVHTSARAGPKNCVVANSDVVE